MTAWSLMTEEQRAKAVERARRFRDENPEYMRIWEKRHRAKRMRETAEARRDDVMTTLLREKALMRGFYG